MEKLCVFCKHWDFYGGEPHYSEVTPGVNSSMSCRKNHKMRGMTDLDSEDDFRKEILLAKTCQDYETFDTKES